MQQINKPTLQHERVLGMSGYWAWQGTGHVRVLGMSGYLACQGTEHEGIMSVLRDMVSDHEVLRGVKGCCLGTKISQ